MLDVTSSTRAAHDSVAGCGGGDTTRFWSGAADTLSCIAVMERSTSSASSVVETSEESRRVVLRSEKYQHKAAAPYNAFLLIYNSLLQHKAAAPYNAFLLIY